MLFKNEVQRNVHGSKREETKESHARSFIICIRREILLGRQIKDGHNMQHAWVR
jgi:hypothetical protein